MIVSIPVAYFLPTSNVFLHDLTNEQGLDNQFETFSQELLHFMEISEDGEGFLVNKQSFQVKGDLLTIEESLSLMVLMQFFSFVQPIKKRSSYVSINMQFKMIRR